MFAKGSPGSPGLPQGALLSGQSVPQVLRTTSAANSIFCWTTGRFVSHSFVLVLGVESAWLRTASFISDHRLLLFLMERRGVATSTPRAFRDFFDSFLYLAFYMCIKLIGVAGHLQNSH